MFSKLRRWISLNMFEKEKDRRMARILLTMILVYWVGSLIVLFMDLTWGDSSLAVFLILGCVLQFFPLVMLLKGKLSASSFATIGIYIGFTTLFATSGQGIQDYVIMTYPAVIMFAGLTNQKRGLVLSTLLTLVSLAWLVFGEMNGWFVVHKIFFPNLFDLIIACLLIIVTAIAVDLLVTNFAHGLTQTRREFAERLRVEGALRESEARYHALVEASPDAIALTDLQGNILVCNQRAAALHGFIDAREMLECNVFMLLLPEEHEFIKEKILQSVHMGGGSIIECTMLRKDGTDFSGELSISMILNEAGSPDKIIGVSRDITERKRIEDDLRVHVQEVEQRQVELREQAIRDPMTGLYNRRYMKDIFNREFSRAERENYSVCVIMLDMDELKMFNDTYGHDTGDRAIQALAARLQSMIRNEDFCCRYGGDEFTIILSKTTPLAAAKRVNEWRKEMNNHLLEIEKKDKIEVLIKFTAGIACFPLHGTSVDEVLNYADVALYRAKAQGRNRTIIFE